MSDGQVTLGIWRASLSLLFYFLSFFLFWSLVLVRQAVSDLDLLEACSFGQLQLLPIANSLSPPSAGHTHSPYLPFFFTLFPPIWSPVYDGSSLYRQQRLIPHSIFNVFPIYGPISHSSLQTDFFVCFSPRFTLLYFWIYGHFTLYELFSILHLMFACSFWLYPFLFFLSTVGYCMWQKIIAVLRQFQGTAVIS